MKTTLNKLNAILLTTALLILSACSQGGGAGGGGGASAPTTTTTTLNPNTPPVFSYSPASQVLTVGSTLSATSPSISAGTPTSYSVSPALPSGLSLNTSTGAISGSPTATAASAAYSVTGLNAFGSHSSNINITVNVAAPGTLTYSKQTARYARNYVVQNNTPSATGGSPSSYSISPSLPSGLSFNTSTGVISGTPTSISAAANYTVTATNVSGSATRVLSIEIAEPWTRFTSGDSSTAAYYLATVSDTSGNVYATGRSNKGMDGNTHSSAGASGNDLILTKWNSSGTKLWTQQIGTGGGFSANANGMAIDSDSNLYLTGESTGNIDGVTKSGSSDMLLIKYDSNGNKQWTRLLGSAANVRGESIVTDSSNNVYIAGVTSSHLDGQTRTGTRDLFVTKYNSSGTRQWTRLLGVATFVTEAYAIAIDSSSSVYATGVTYGGLDGNTRVGSRDMYVVKYDSSGNKQWTYQMGAATNPVSAISEGRGIKVDQSGYIYVTGHTYGNFDSNARTGAVDVFIVKLNSAGAKQFSAQYGKAGSGLFPQSLTVDTSGNLYVAGWTDAQGIGSIAQIGNKDAFVARFSPAGSFEWAATKGVAASETIAYSVNTNSSGEVIACGSSSAGFDNNTISGTAAFVTKLNTAGFQQ